jgi:hypothetical protein
LYPVWLPYVRKNTSGWHSTISVRNNSSTYQAMVNTTFFNRDGTVSQQLITTIPSRAVVALTAPSGFDGAALVVSSEDVAVVVREESGGELNEYNGVTALTSEASPGWEKADSTVYVPLIKNARYGRSSKLYLMNVGQQSTVANVQFNDVVTGQFITSTTEALGVNASVRVQVNLCTSGTSRCSVKMLMPFSTTKPARPHHRERAGPDL